MIINIRGTNGSGKTWVVRRLMEYFGAIPILTPAEKIEGYQLGQDGAGRVVGRYNVASGGCDRIDTQDEVGALVARYAAAGNVVFEGLLVSGIFDRWKTFARGSEDFRWVFLSTPLEKCIENIRARRVLDGKDPAFNPANVESKYRSVVAVHYKAENAGLKVWKLPSDAALSLITDWLTP